MLAFLFISALKKNVNLASASLSFFFMQICQQAGNRNAGKASIGYGMVGKSPAPSRAVVSQLAKLLAPRCPLADYYRTVWC